MMKGKFSWELFNRVPAIGIMRNIPQPDMEMAAKVFHRAGLTNLEITMNSAGAEGAIASLSSLYGDSLNIGAGTVCSMHDLERALQAGAGFIVAPIINEEVIGTCVSRKIPVFPGAHTPTEIYKAWSLGATMVKVFPATTTGYIKEVLAPLNYISLLPTGGIDLENFTAYFDAGAKAVGIGSHLFPKDIIGRQDWQGLYEIYRSFVMKCENYIKTRP